MPGKEVIGLEFGQVLLMFRGGAELCEERGAVWGAGRCASYRVAEHRSGQSGEEPAVGLTAE
jgi:hypothetical protein